MSKKMKDIFSNTPKSIFTANISDELIDRINKQVDAIKKEGIQTNKSKVIEVLLNLGLDALKGTNG